MSHEIISTINWNGLDINLEYLRNSIRFADTDHPVTLTADYGHFKATLSDDGEELDCYVGQHLESPNLFRITQLTQDGSFDEFKFCIGFLTALECQEMFLQNMPEWAYGGIQTSSIDEIKKYTTMQMLLWDCFAQWLSDETKNKLGIGVATMGYNTLPTIVPSVSPNDNTEGAKNVKESLSLVNNLIEISLRAISDRCDGGQLVDGKGFRPGDAILVSRLLSKPMADWDSTEEEKAINLLYRYRKQLKDFGIDYNALIPAITDDSSPNAIADSAKENFPFRVNAEGESGKAATIAQETTVVGEAAAVEGFTYSVLEKAANGLPLIVEFEGPAEGKSLNHYVNEKGEKIHREWSFEAFDRGTSVTQKFIDKGIYPRVQLSHPDDDPEETGKFPSGELLALETIPQRKRLRGKVRLYHTTDEGLEVARRYQAEDFPDYSIRTRPTCSDNDLFGQCMPNPGMPLLVDFLRSNERPGLPGSKGTRTIETLVRDDEQTFLLFALGGVAAVPQAKATEAHSCNDCATKEHKEKCAKCKSVIIIPSIKESKVLPKPKTLRVFENINNNFPSAGKGFNSGNYPRKQKIKGVEFMPNMMAFLDKLAGTENPEVRKAMADTAKMLVTDTDADPADDMAEVDDPNADPTMDDPNKKPEGEMDEKAYEKLFKKQGVKGLVKAITTEVVKTIKPTAAKETVTEDPTQVAKAKKQAILEALGQTEEEYDQEQAEKKAKKDRASLEANLRASHKKALDAKETFCGHNISDDTAYPATAVESAIRSACLESTLDKAEGYLKAELASVAKEAKRASEAATTPTGFLNNDTQVINSRIVTTENYREVKNVVEEVKNIFIGQMKERDPKAFENYEYNKNLPSFQRNADKAIERCIQTYGAKAILCFNNKKAWESAVREDVNPNGFSNMPNYAAVMTALMVVRQWRKSPIWELVGNAPGVAVKAVGNVVGSAGNGPMGQFVEISSETRSQRRDYDAQYIQSALDPQPEISLYQQPHQYFAYQESSRIRWTDELEAFMKMDPYRRDEAARAIVNLLEELDLFTEQRISTEIMRASDAYKCTTVTNETTNIAATNCWSYTGGTSGITLPDGTVVGNGIGWVWMRRGYTSGTTTPVYGPVVRPGTDPTLNRSTLTFPATYPVNINAINGKTQYRGMYDSVNQIGVKINASDPDPTFIIFADIGLCVFLIGSNFDATHMPTFSQYSVVANVLRFDFTATGSETRAAIANRYVEAVSSMNSTFSMRQTNDNVRKFLLTANPIMQNVVAFTDYIKPLTQLPYATPSATYRNNGNGKVMQVLDVDYMGTSEPLYNTNYRAILGTPGGTVYDELMPPVLGGLDQGALIDQNGNVAYNSTKSRSVTRRAVVATIYPRNQNDIQENFGLAGVYHVAFPQTSGLPL